MYGVRNTEAGQSYYDSLIEMYASWGVDFIKCDDICDSFIYWNDSFSDGMKAKCYTRLFRNQTGKLYSAFPLVLHILTVRGSIADMQTCGVLRMISGITGSFLRICSGDVSHGRIM